MKFQIFSILKINFYEWLISGHFFKKSDHLEMDVSLTEKIEIVNLSWEESRFFVERFYGSLV